MFDKIVNSWNLAKQSFGVLRKDKELIVFPALSGIATLLVIASFVAPVVAHYGVKGLQEAMENRDWTDKGWLIAWTFAFYFCTYFVTIFCNAALIGAVMIRLDGRDPTIGDGMRIAFQRIGAILGWALVSATVGMILHAMESKKSSLPAKIIASILGTAWSVMTYLAVPVLVVENVGPWAALKRSASLLRKTWGEQIIGNLGLGAFFTVIGFVGTIVFGGIGFVLAGPIAAGVAVAVYWAILAVLSQTLGAIYQASVYYFATGKPLPTGLDRSLIESAFVPVGND